MNIYLNATAYERLYSCEYLNVTQWRHYGEKRPIFGSVCVILGTIYLCAYIPCLIIMGRKEFFDKSCYKLMFLIGCIDILGIFVNSFITGFLLMSGGVFCSAPDFNYFTGLAAVCLWCGECLACTILALNRFVDFWFSKASNVLFDGHRTYVWFLAIFAYMLYFALFTRSVGFSSASMHWILDPYDNVPTSVITIDRSIYFSQSHYVNNFVLIPALFMIYFLLIISISLKGKSAILKVQCQLILQSGLVVALLFVPGCLYTVIEFMESAPRYLSAIALLFWQIGNGGGGLIYMNFNRNIRAVLFREMDVSLSTHTSVVKPIAEASAMQKP